jgi:hypothetical protein
MKTFIKEVLWKSISRTRYASDLYYFRNKYRLKSWAKNKYQFIHVPKCAGTSIAKSLELPDPGHFTYKQMKNYGVTSEEFLNFAVVRNPLDRIVSTFKYAKEAQSKNGENPLSWIARYNDVDDFILNGLNERDVRNNYFLMPSQKYIEGCPDDSLFLIAFEDVEGGFNEVLGMIGEKK